ncbi:MAG: class I SAM-dependent methyltransferase [Candidatus Omnitrophica bacterium]|nr:class I SAM-dependent methyltransferase [Candidatus Omnitrophota bacterium]
MIHDALNNMGSLCERAIIEGQKIDLKKCIYENLIEKVTRPEYYYYFLAGFVRIFHLTHILEIGTHFGGSIMSMSRGLSELDVKKCRLVTVDVTNENREGFLKLSHIKRIHGDSLEMDTIQRIEKCFDRDIDLLFIDSIHEYGHVAKCIMTYGEKLRPRYILLHDIYFNFSMRKLWQRLKLKFKDRIFDITEITKTGRCGMGLIVCEYPMSFDFSDKLDYFWHFVFCLKGKLCNKK